MKTTKAKRNPLAYIWLPLMVAALIGMIVKQDAGYLFEALICWIMYEAFLTND